MFLLCKIPIKHIHSSNPIGIIEGIPQPDECWGEVITPGQTIPYPINITWEQWLNRTLDWIEINNEWWFYTTDENLWEKYNEATRKK